MLIPISKIKLGHQALGETWVYKIKHDVNKNIAYFKARWVIKDYLQQFEVDFNQVFVAIIKSIAYKVLFVDTAFFNFDINHINIKTAFLYRLTNQLFYIDILKGSKIKTNWKIVCQQVKILYSLK